MINKNYYCYCCYEYDNYKEHIKNAYHKKNEELYKMFYNETYSIIADCKNSNIILKKLFIKLRDPFHKKIATKNLLALVDMNTDNF